MSDTTKIKQDFDKKVAEIKALMKNPQQDAGETKEQVLLKGVLNERYYKN
ncbi:hypothetical protein [Borreliella turdi]